MPQERRSTTLIDVDPVLAQHIIGTMTYEYQRPVRSHKVTQYANAMREGTFLAATTIRIMRTENAQYLVDGQHRLRAVIESGVTLQFNVVEIAGVTPHDVAVTYGSLDVGMVRSPGDRLKPHELDKELGLSHTDIGDLSPAVQFLATGCTKTSGRKGRESQTELIRWIRLYGDAMRTYKNIVNESLPRRVRSSALRSSMVAVALLTIRFALPLAERTGKPDVLEFWRGSLFDDGIALGDPRKLVNRHLLTVGIGAGTVASRHNLTFVSPAYAARYIATCFNAYMARETRKMAKVVDTAAPLGLYGVPADSEEWMR